jgi:hypothetical protein
MLNSFAASAMADVSSGASTVPGVESTLPMKLSASARIKNNLASKRHFDLAFWPDVWSGRQALPRSSADHLMLV